MENNDYLSQKYAELEKYYKAMGLKISLPAFAGLMAFFGVAVSAIVVLILKTLPPEFQGDIFLPIVSFITILSLTIGIPHHMRTTRIEQIEENLPDALKHMASVLRSGGTTESALEEVAISDYGPLSKDLSEALRKLREGKSFDDVISDAAENSGSHLFERTTAIIIDARKAGAGLADVMESIASDSREYMRVQRERKARTVMPVGFLLLTSMFIAPFIFGFSLTLVKFIGIGIAQATGTESTQYAQFDLLLKFFLSGQVLASNVAISIIREGKPYKNLLYYGIMLLVALAIYVGGSLIGLAIIGSNNQTLA